MALHRFVPTHFHNILGSSDPVLQIADGDTVITMVSDDNFSMIQRNLLLQFTLAE